MENEAIKTVNHKGLAIKIFQDWDSQSPDEWGDDNLFLVHYHRDFEIRRDDIILKDELIAWYNGEKIDIEKKYHFFLTKAYIHSRVVLALEESGIMFPDERWDVSWCGCVLVSKKEARTKKKAYKLAEGLIKSWNDCLSGNVYGYIIEDKEGNNLSSCWGFYGDIEESGILSEAKAEAEAIAEERMKKHLLKLKGQIKRKAPLEKREPVKKW